MPTSALTSGSAAGSAARASRAASARRCTASASPAFPTLTVSSATSKMRLRQGPPRRKVGLPAEQRPELAVEVDGRLQQPVAQGLEPRLLEQEVLADAGVERLDRVHRQPVPLLHALVRGDEVGVGLRLAARRLGQLGVLAREPRVGRRLHGDDGDGPRRRGPAARGGQGRHRRPPPAPEPGPLGRPTGRAAMGRLSSQRCRSSARAWPARRSAAAGPSPGTSGRSSPGRAAPAALSLRGGSGGCSRTCVERLRRRCRRRTAAGRSAARRGSRRGRRRRPPS